MAMRLNSSEKKRSVLAICLVENPTQHSMIAIRLNNSYNSHEIQ